MHETLVGLTTLNDLPSKSVHDELFCKVDDF